MACGTLGSGQLLAAVALEADAGLTVRELCGGASRGQPSVSLRRASGALWADS